MGAGADKVLKASEQGAVIVLDDDLPAGLAAADEAAEEADQQAAGEAAMEVAAQPPQACKKARRSPVVRRHFDALTLIGLCWGYLESAFNFKAECRLHVAAYTQRLIVSPSGMELHQICA